MMIIIYDAHHTGDVDHANLDDKVDVLYCCFGRMMTQVRMTLTSNRHSSKVIEALASHVSR